MYNIITDPEFGYYRVDPIPTTEEVERYYAEDFYSLKNPAFNDSSLEVQKKDKIFFDSRWQRLYDVCEECLGDLKGKSIFDVGFGYAQTLLFFKDKGLVCSGIEPSLEGVEYAQKAGINARQAGIESESSYMSDKRQDIVMLINVLEHLRLPFDTLTNIKDHLISDDGVLIIDVPNEYNTFQTIANSEYDLNEWWVSPPKHINYFTPSSLKNLLEKAGFEVVKCESSFPIELFLLFGDMYVGNPDLGTQCHKKRVLFETLMIKNGHSKKLYELYEKLAELELGRQIVIYARPKR